MLYFIKASFFTSYSFLDLYKICKLLQLGSWN